MKQEPKRDETEYLLSTEANRNRLLCKDCNKSLDDCTCIEDTIELKDAAENHAKIFQFPFDCDPAETFMEGAKWQQERMYSEEEVIQLVSDWTDYRMSEDTKSKITFKKWFEQFKINRK